MTIMAQQSSPAMSMQIKQQLPTGLLSVAVHEQLFSLDSLMGFAARANLKRGFLFLSKVLGKHWPVRPSLMKEIHEALAEQIAADLPEPVVFIAMAETAVGLGQGVFEAYQRMHPEKSVLFIHTTRYHVGDYELIEFEEAHSHAPRQFIHMPKDALMKNKIMQAQSLVMVDDEASTGNTFLNLKNAFQQFNPNIRRLHLSTITNFMGQERNNSLSVRFGLEVTIGSALTGEYDFQQCEYLVPDVPAQAFQTAVDRGASTEFGRVGITHELVLDESQVSTLAQSLSPDAKVLVLGTGEFMHPAYRLGLALEARGLDVKVQSTTRSPIMQWGDVSSILQFADNYGEGISNFVYNVADRQYDHVFLCHETPVNDALLETARQTGADLIQFTKESHFEKISLC